MGRRHPATAPSRCLHRRSWLRVLTPRWPVGSLDVGHYDVALQLCDPPGRSCNTGEARFSFDLPNGDWSSKYTSNLETGTFPDSYAWIWFLGPIDAVSTDPCAGKRSPVNGSLSERANALTTIGGTDAVGPTDVTVGGHAAKLVELTLRGEPACSLTDFWLFGKTSFYPNTSQSRFRVWMLDVAGAPFAVYSDSASPDPDVEQQILQIVDSVQFE
jgi:hypothetical protein